MRTNDNLSVLAIVLSGIAILLVFATLIIAVGYEKDVNRMRARVAELEEETVITQRTINQAYHVLVTMGIISDELARRQLGLEERE